MKGTCTYSIYALLFKALSKALFSLRGYAKLEGWVPRLFSLNHSLYFSTANSLTLCPVYFYYVVGSTLL